jgi:signal transduction histidine kinase
VSARPVDESSPFLAGGGELGELIRTHDWSATPLGAPSAWPESLRIAVRIMLASRQPIWIGWGDELTYLYNDPYKTIIGGKHPDALGLPTHVVWAEIWDVISPMLETALTGVSGTYVESQLLIMERYGYREETYYTFSYSPIPAGDGRAGGIICANTDDTRRVVGERQLALLRDLAARTADVRTWEEAASSSAAALGSNQRDLPFALVYVADEDGAALSLAGASGIVRSHPAAPARIAVDAAGPWPLRDALGGRDVVVVDIAPSATALPTGAWDEPPTHAALVPLAAAGEAGREGVLVAALNPFRRFDAAYEDFLALVGGQIAASIASALAYEAERRRAEALAEIDRAKTVFFSNVSHEFRTPLTLMLGPLEDVLGRSEDIPADDRVALEVVRRNALRLMRMVNTVLDFSRAGTSHAATSFHPTRLEHATAEIVDRFRSLLERAGVGLVTQLDPLPHPVYVDVDAWEKIVLNLLSNAFKFTLDGEIRVTLDAEGDRAVLRVADTGAGIPEDEVAHIFERFHRVRNQQARTYEGTGIGLALVRELVELHGGEIGVESIVGDGTAFTVALPFGYEHLAQDHVAHDPRELTSAEIAAAYAEEAGRWIGVEPDAQEHAVDAPPADDADRVVVVDDNADMRDYVVGLLKRHWRVDAYADGKAALDGIRRDPPALVVTDVMMPRLDGFGLLKALRADARTATIPVIVVSARAGEESSVEGLDAGADDYLVKPFSARELVARVRVNLELARLRAEAGRFSALEEVRSRVITTVSHELRTPVAAIYGAAETIRRHTDLDDETQRRLVDVVASESERLARITNDILTTETLASGVFALASDRLDLREVAADAVAAASARTNGGTIRLHAPPSPVAVRGDRSRLDQVLANLLDNAVKYSPKGADVDVDVAEANGTGRVVVADHGLGIPEASREQIFHRFYRVDPELTGGVGGSGLGLHICRELVDRMGGTISVEANEPRGSRFVVALPSA